MQENKLGKIMQPQYQRCQIMIRAGMENVTQWLLGDGYVIFYMTFW